MIKENDKIELLTQFCEDWNNRGFNPKLYPVQCVPEKFAEEVVRAQLDYEAENAIALPDDVQNADEFLAWARSFETEDLSKMDVVFLQVAAIDQRDRVTILDVEMTVGNDGYYDPFNHIVIYTILTGFSRRRTWIEPGMLKKREEYIAGDRLDYRNDHAMERVNLFRKGLQAMITAKHKDVQAKIEKQKRNATETEKMQAMIDEIKRHGIATKTLEDKKMMTASIENGKGQIVFKKGGLKCTLTTSSSTKERESFATLVGSLMVTEQKDTAR